MADRHAWRRRSIAAVVVALVLLGWTIPAASAAPPPARDIREGCEDRSSDGGFTDVDPASPHRPAIDCVVGWGITTGTAPGRFSPATRVTRGQAASFIARLVEQTGGALAESIQDSFDDDNGTVHERSINRVAASGLMSGAGDRRFLPAQEITREQLASIVASTYELRAGEALPATPEDFFDDDDGSAHEANINRVAAAGIASGRSDGAFDPTGTVPRDAMASFLARLIDALVQDGGIGP